MSAELFALCFDAADPTGLARFWADALGGDVEPRDGGWVALVPTNGAGLQLHFLPDRAEKVEKNRIHLDLSTASVDDQIDTVERLITGGAHHIDVGQGPEDTHVVLADPEGNEFCVLAPGNSFVDDQARLGSITCDGSVEVGHFWSQALGWPLVWDQDDETAIRSPDGTGPFITWGPPVVPKVAKNRLHLDIVAAGDSDQSTEVGRLEGLGARRIDIGQGEVPWVVMADPDGNEFCVLAGAD